MGTPVPQDDMPNLVPAHDLPDSPPSYLSRAKESFAPYGIAEAGASLLSGAVATPLAGLAGIGQAGLNAVGLGTTSPADRVRGVQNALTIQPKTAIGQGITGAVSYPFEKLAVGADAAGGAVADTTRSPALGAAVNTAIQAAPMALGGLARVAPGESAASIASRAKQQSLNAPRDAGLVAAKNAGLRVPPAQAGANSILQMIEGLAGEPKTAKLFSKKNAPVINDLVRRDLALPEDQPVTRAALMQIRADEGKAYEAVKNIGRIDTDPNYFADMAKITKSYDTASKDFAHRSENPFKSTLDGLTKDGENQKAGFDAASLVEEVKLLRGDADTAYAQRNAGLGKAFKSAAQALDDMLARHVQKLAQADPAMANIATDYLAARTRIAKTYAADKALSGDAGNINADVYAKAFKANKPLSGDALTVGKFAAQFPRSAQRVDKLGSTGPTIFDAGLGLAGAAGSLVHPYAAGVVLAASRPLLRQALTLHTPAPPNYGPGLMRRLMEASGSNGSLAALGAGTASVQPTLDELLRQNKP